ncbi:GDSL esterase/lipase At1g71250-like [Tripterygium wilfordii]|uniref:GDSL esterase/lipase At1g71250-like n=1 Tax=Tripterygium wilfordii TaxID=458696 RepID=UPI0018F83AE6|nr:GDSL esterase/lipase At1g71250-like [Tripterygium wilfordii]
MRKSKRKQTFSASTKKIEMETAAAVVGRRGIFLLCILAILVGMASVTNGQFSTLSTEGGSYGAALYVMGDSSVDCGDNTLFYPLVRHNLSLLPCNGSASLLPHLLAGKIGLPYIPSFYSQNGSIDGLLSGVNYGSAQATIMKPSSQSHQSLNQQLRQVSETFQILQLQLGDDSAQRFIRSSIFYLSFGKDDYIDLFLRNTSGIMLKYSGPEFAHILVSQMVDAIKYLYDANVRKIICLGILPLGCTPRAVLDWYNITAVGDDDYGSGCVEEINELILEYNTMLDERIVEMKSELPDAQIIFCDVYQGIMEIITNQNLYGFKDIENACCGVGLRGAMVGCLSVEMACNDAADHVWWDLYNPTHAVNSLLADSTWSGQSLPSICRPFSVQNLVSTSVPDLN